MNIDSANIKIEDQMTIIRILKVQDKFKGVVFFMKGNGEKKLKKESIVDFIKRITL